MKKFLKKLKQFANNTLISTRDHLKSRKGESYVDTGVKVLIAVVLGALLLEGLYLLFTDVIDPTAYGKIVSLFFYKG